MKTIALLTLNGNENYGNKLQHYATQKILEKYNFQIETINIHYYKKMKISVKYIIKTFISYIRNITMQNISRKRLNNFKKFDKLIKYSKTSICKNKIKDNIHYDYYIVGSDQVWNTTFHTFCNYYLLENIETENKISFSSSFGTSYLDEKYKDLFANNLTDFKAISVREEQAKKIIEDLIERKDVEVLVDPTMLLTSEEWDEVSNRPKQLDEIKEDKYILNYFLGELSDLRKEEIKRIAKENNCHIINLLDKSDSFYTCGPSEFLYLEKHAFLICTDSFHSSVFALLYDRPFIIFDREDKFKNMSSRLDTLINKFKLKNRRYNGENITRENLEHNYTGAYSILDKERMKSFEFLKKALDINEVIST